MALTLEESAKLSQNQLHRGVIATLVRECDFLAFLPFDETVGNAEQIVREKAVAVAPTFHAPGGAWPNSNNEYDAVTFALKILGVNVATDNFARLTRSNFMDQRAEQISSHLALTADGFIKTLIDGDEALDSTKFTGLRASCTTGNDTRLTQDVSGVIDNGGPLSLHKVDLLMSKTRAKGPGAFLCSSRTKTWFAELYRQGHGNLVTRDIFGEPIVFYAGRPICECNHISDALTVGGSSDCTELYYVTFDAARGMRGMQSRGEMQVIKTQTGDLYLPGPEVIPIGESENGDYWVDRIRWYASIKYMTKTAAACLDGIRDGVQ